MWYSETTKKPEIKFWKKRYSSEKKPKKGEKIQNYEAISSEKTEKKRKDSELLGISSEVFFWSFRKITKVSEKIQKTSELNSSFWTKKIKDSEVNLSFRFL